MPARRGAPASARAQVYQAFSADRGATWTPAVATQLQNPAARVATARAGRVLLCIHNPDVHRRAPLVLAASHDGARSWEQVLRLHALPLMHWLRLARAPALPCARRPVRGPGS